VLAANDLNGGLHTFTLGSGTGSADNADNAAFFIVGDSF
jgi:hypothetical protein